MINTHTDDENDNMSVTSEPIVTSMSPTICTRVRSESEGASPDDTDMSRDDEYEDYDDEYDDPIAVRSQRDVL